MKTGNVFAHMTATHVVFTDDEDGYTEEHGWIDPPWSLRQLHDSRNDTRPLVNMSINDEGLQEELQDILAGYDNMGDGLYYSRDATSYKPNESWTYAIHLTHKYFGPKGWVEVPYAPES